MSHQNTHAPTDGTPIVSAACPAHSTGATAKNLGVANPRGSFGLVDLSNLPLHSTIQCDDRPKYQRACGSGYTKYVRRPTGFGCTRERLRSSVFCYSAEVDHVGPIPNGRPVVRQHPLTMTDTSLPPSESHNDVHTYASAWHKFCALDRFQFLCSHAVLSSIGLQSRQVFRPTWTVGRAGPPPPPT